MEDCELYGDPCHLLIEVQRLQARIKKLEKECQDRKGIENSLQKEIKRRDGEVKELESQLKDILKDNEYLSYLL